MAMSLDQVFGVPAAALKVQSERVQLIGENLANADTPNYKARDVDFRAALAEAGGRPETLTTTDPRHLALGGGANADVSRVQYRVPANPSLDGNTVETHREQTRFAETTVQYQAGLNLLGTRIQGIIGALKGK